MDDDVSVICEIVKTHSLIFPFSYIEILPDFKFRSEHSGNS